MRSPSTSQLSTSSPCGPIVVSGMGAVTPYGEGVDTLWQALLRGESAISEMDLFDLGGIACTRAGVIRGYVPPEGFSQAPRASGFAAGACREALSQAGLLGDAEACAGTALITASNFADIDIGERALIPAGHPGRLEAEGIRCAHAEPTARLADAFGLGGLRLPLSLSCASGAAAVACGADLIASGRAVRVLVVGYDALSRFAWSGLCSLRTMTKEDVRPFDVNRAGTIFTEGAAALVIERRDVCVARGAAPLARLDGWATGNNGHHMTAPAPRGAGSTFVMRGALARAGLAPEAVDHVNVHGTGTKPNDTTETQALYDLFGARAATLPVTSVKGLLGHMLGAAGSVELVVSVLSLQHGLIPPTGNLQSQDPECALDVVTSPRALPLRCVLSNSAGFGGCNAAAVLTGLRCPTDEVQAVASAALQPSVQPVVITGLGAVSAFGADAEEGAAALRENEPALFPLTRFTMPGAAEPPRVGEAPGLDLAACGVAPKPYLDRASELFLAACGQALRQAGLSAESLAMLEAGIFAGTAWGCMGTAETFFADYITKGPRLVKPFLFPHAYSNTAVSLAAMEWSLKGPHGNFVSPHAASGIALVEAFDQICSGQAPVIVAGGVDALSVTRLAVCADDAPAGEAAAVMVLESAASAAARGARPLARLLGCGLGCSVKEAAEAALAQAGSVPVAIYANQAAQGDAAACFAGIPYRAPESLCGDVQGATTALHVALALLAGHDGPVLVLTADTRTCVAFVVARAAT